MKVSITDQIEEAEIHRDALVKAAMGKPDLAVRRDRSEAILLTLHAWAAYEPEIKKSNINEGA